MKKNILAIIAFTGLAFGYNFDTHIRKVESSYCEKLTPKKSFCMKESKEFPLIVSKNKHLQKKINSSISRLAPKLNSYTYVKKHLRETNGQGFLNEHYNSTTISILSVLGRTYSLTSSSSAYMGGAHGNYASKSYNYDRATGRKLKLNELFIPNYRNRLTKIANRVYRHQNRLMKNESLTKLGWFDNRFILPESIGITTKGLLLEYNPYEIKPYAAGITSFTIPFFQLKNIVPRNSYLSGVVNRSVSKHKKAMADNRARVNRELQRTGKRTIVKRFRDKKRANTTVEAKVKRNNIVKLKISTEILKNAKNGFVSISFPQLKFAQDVMVKRQRGFRHIKKYPKGSMIYNQLHRKAIRANYLLVEGNALNWHNKELTTIVLKVRVPQRMKNLYVNVRTSFRTRNGKVNIPSEMDMIEGQQGYSNYRLKIPLL